MLSKSLKIFALFLILLYIFLDQLGYTAADIFAERTVSRNKISAITLDFSTLSSSQESGIAKLFDSSFQPGGFDLKAIRIKGMASNDFKYRIKAVKTGGDDLLCNNLEVEILNRRFSRKFSGRLLDLDLAAENDNNLQDWIFMISLDSNDPELKNKSCQFDLDIKTYHDNPAESGGIYAQRILSNNISTGTW